MWRRAFACGLLVLVGCSEKSPTTPEAQDLPPNAALPEKSIDEQIAEALKTVDPIVIYKREPLADDENAFVLWQEGITKLVEIEDKELEAAFEETLGDEPFPRGEIGRRLTAWLALNVPALKLIDAGAARVRCQFPKINGPEAELPYLAWLRQAARVKLIRVKMLASQGRYDAAAAELLSTIRLGELIAHGDGCIINWLVGIACEGIGMRGARWVATTPAITECALETLVAGLRPDPRARESLASSLRVELMCSFVIFIKQFLEGRIGETIAQIPGAIELRQRVLKRRLAGVSEEVIEPLDIGETIGLAGDVYARAVRDSRRSWKDRYRNFTGDASAQITHITINFEEALRDTPFTQELAGAVHNWGGKLFVGLLLPPMDAVIERLFRVRTDRSATRAVLALRLFEMRNGRLPVKLDELVTAGILDSVPIDPFADKPLRYSQERRRVWSVGPDESDDGGRDEPAKWTGKDYVLEIPGAGTL